MKDIAKRTILANYAPFLGADMALDFIASGQSDKEIDVGMDSCIVMVHDGEIIGFSIARANLLHLLMVAPEHQGKGHGAKLLAHTERQLFTQHPMITLQTFRRNTNAIAFYQKCGWREVAGQTIEGTEIPVVVFRKSR